VFKAADPQFADTSGITTNAAKQWLMSLINEDRTAQTIATVWKTALKTVFSWAVGEKLVAENPFKVLRISVPRRVTERETKAFTEEEAHTILMAALAYREQKSVDERARRWVPWICTMGTSLVLVPLPKVRAYVNVTLHVSRTASGLGKHVMDEKKQHRLNRLAADMATRVPERSIFLCVHKHSEPLAKTFATGSLINLNVGHWGAVDGKNCWKDCNVAVIWGLPYMAEHHAIDQLFAVLGHKVRRG
jgi:hypothetical protein